MIEDAKSGAVLPIGPQVDASAAKRPGRTTLRGRLVTLAPLDPTAHGDALYAATRGEAADQLWMYLFEGPFSSRADFDLHLAADGRLGRPVVPRDPGRGFRRRVGIRRLHADRACTPGNRGGQHTVHAAPATHRSGYRGDVPDGSACLRGSRLSPLRVEVQCPERTFASSGVAFRFYLRGDFPATHDCQRPQSGYGLVLHARFRMAGTQSQFRALAGSIEFWSGRPAKDGSLGAQSQSRPGRTSTRYCGETPR